MRLLTTLAVTALSAMSTAHAWNNKMTCTYDGSYYLSIPSSQWPQTSMTIGKLSYSAAQMKTMMQQGTSSSCTDQSVILATALIPVLEDILGYDTTTSNCAVQQCITQAQSYLSQYAPNHSPAYTISGSTLAGFQATAQCLQQYACGSLAGSPGACSGVQCHTTAAPTHPATQPPQQECACEETPAPIQPECACEEVQQTSTPAPAAECACEETQAPYNPCPNNQGAYQSFGQPPAAGYSCLLSSKCGSQQCTCGSACYDPTKYCCYNGHLGQAKDTVCSCPAYAPTQVPSFDECGCHTTAVAPMSYNYTCGCFVDSTGSQYYTNGTVVMQSSSGSTTGSSGSGNMTSASGNVTQVYGLSNSTGSSSSGTTNFTKTTSFSISGGVRQMVEVSVLAVMAGGAMMVV